MLRQLTRKLEIERLVRLHLILPSDDLGRAVELRLSVEPRGLHSRLDHSEQPLRFTPCLRVLQCRTYARGIFRGLRESDLGIQCGAERLLSTDFFLVDRVRSLGRLEGISHPF